MEVTEVVAALIRRGDTFLICKRPAGKARAHLWEFVGGKTERGESKEEALKRECREELEIDVTVGEVYAEVTHAYPDLTVHLTLFNCSIGEQTPRPTEHEAIEWIEPSRIPFYRFCPADEVILQKLQREGKR